VVALAPAARPRPGRPAQQAARRAPASASAAAAPEITATAHPTAITVGDRVTSSSGRDAAGEEGHVSRPAPDLHPFEIKGYSVTPPTQLPTPRGAGGRLRPGGLRDGRSPDPGSRSRNKGPGGEGKVTTEAQAVIVKLGPPPGPRATSGGSRGRSRSPGRAAARPHGGRALPPPRARRPPRAVPREAPGAARRREHRKARGAAPPADEWAVLELNKLAHRAS